MLPWESFLWFGQYSHTYTYIQYRLFCSHFDSFRPGTRFETLKLRSGVNEELGRMEQVRSPVEPGRFCHRDNVGLTALFHSFPSIRPSGWLAYISTLAAPQWRERQLLFGQLPTFSHPLNDFFSSIARFFYPDQQTQLGCWSHTSDTWLVINTLLNKLTRAP